ncbi:hypothetical protein DPSP01_003144 [Paraphaeosphaeria sporulosa]|uniref:CBD9-like protein n=1 Tax=Paraphaeosphaeria sporulosa TaxID=1460663 RepID=A0A177C1K2_9PLEO|nr:CBD9-like protein [Paraphaeosphaeria sporulosa]OAG01523.1 CBD9-like protein [Paraphaeosphaeria sporulosa]
MKLLARLGPVLAAFALVSSASSDFEVVRREAGPSNATFVHDTGSGSVVFAVAAVKDVGDLYFHLEAPAEYSWVAVGSGEEMDGSLMWVAYRSENGTGVTLSSRTSDGHVEPSYNSGIDCQISTRNGTSNGIIKINNRDILAVNGVCKNITRITASDSKGAIDLTSSSQNFIFGLGPTGKTIQSDSKSAGIRRHTLYGQFSLDLSKATVANTEDVDEAQLSSVGNWQNANAQVVGDVTSDRDWSGPAHVVLMGGAFVIVFPLGVVFLRVLEKVKWHAWMQGVGMVLAIIGLGVGIYLGREYNHSKDFNSAHQIIGLIVVLFALVQFTLGMRHHRVYVRSQRPTTFGRIHRYIGPPLLLLGAINGFLGFNLAGEDDDNIWYGVIVGVIIVALAGSLFWARRRRGGKAAKLGRGNMGRESYEGGHIPLTNMGHGG